jgi:hypothetical protein
MITIEKPKQTLIGPSGTRLHLDASQIYPSRPGEGTPVLIECSNGETICRDAVFDGLLGNAIDLHPVKINQIYDWMHKLATQIEAWENFHWDRIEKQLGK